MIELNQVTLKRDRKTIIDQLDIQFPEQKMTAICGPNGAGKSTLMQALSGELMPDSGEIRFSNRSLDQFSPLEFAKIRAFMPQQVAMAFAFSVQEIIETGLFLTTSPLHQQKVIKKVSDWFDIAEIINKPYPTLSGGQQQRVQLARVVAQLIQVDGIERRYLLLDECSSAMDIATVHKVFKRLKALLQATDLNLTIIAVVHDLNLASLYADELVLLHKGGLCLQGPPDILLTEDNIQQVFDANVHILPHPINNKAMVLPLL